MMLVYESRATVSMDDKDDARSPYRGTVAPPAVVRLSNHPAKVANIPERRLEIKVHIMMLILVINSNTKLMLVVTSER